MFERIEIDPMVCNGKPVVRGTRIPVAVVLDVLAAGQTWDSVLRSYPELVREDIEAVLTYARGAIEHTDITPAAKG
jgi:uncharacterized protein (DUF433 family)